LAATRDTLAGMVDRTWLAQKITDVQAQIDAWEGVLDFFAANNTVQSYTLDTGQSRQTVNRSQLSEIRTLLNSLYNRLSTLEARLNGASIAARAYW
jgi:hypothetical protein